MNAGGSNDLQSLLAELASAGIKLRLLVDGQLEVKAPGGGLSASLRDRLAALKPELARWLSRDDTGSAGTPADAIPGLVHDREQAHAPFPPSDLQASFLIGSREGLEHHVRPHQYMELDYDELDPARFEAALNQVLRHQRLNLAVVREDMRLEVVTDPAPVRVRVSDQRDQPPERAEEAMARVRAAMRRRELPLDRWPWMDIEITRYGGGRGRLHYNNNNFFSDALGTYRFLDSVMRQYRDQAQTLPEVTVSSRDVVLALAGLEDSPQGQAARTYWCDRMAGWPGPPELPLRPGADTRCRSRLVRRELTFPSAQWAAVKRQAGARGLTATSVACAGHAEVLAYWSGSRHFLLNNMISHRLSMPPELAGLIGNFAALYPLEVDWRAAESFAERARRLQAQVIADMAHWQWSGAKVLQTLNQVRGTPGRAACPYAVGSAIFIGQVDRPLHSLLETPQVIFDCEFWELRDGSLWVVWDVIEEMFPAGLIDAMQEGYLAMLSQLAEGDRAWDSVAPDLLPAVQRRQRAAVNAAAAGPRHEGLLHDPLPARAAGLPDHPAVIAPDGTSSYARLGQLANNLAGRLRYLGVRPGDLVAVLAGKGRWQVAAVHAILLAGAAYVPIDPRWPPDRIRYLLDDTAARAVLTTAGLVDDVSSVAGVPVLAIDGQDGQDGHDRHGDGQHWPAARARPGDLAYVIYTSGSTGKPKGVMLDHRGPVNTIADINRRFAVSPADVIFGVSSLCFDLSVYDIFGALAAGATLVLPADDAADPAAWLELAGRHGVTVWNSVPALMRLVAAEAAATGRTLPALRLVLLSGDWIPVELPGQIRAVAPGARVVSLGGATEASIWSICYPVDREEPGWASIPYGKPLANQSWHVLDESGRDAPVWTPGKLSIGGPGVAVGYLGDAGRTAEAFIAHPRTGERLYLTGDLGRYLPTGDIEFLGRTDFQVKIQGFRVEPGEVEHALLEREDVGQAAVVARDAGSGRQLAAFVVGSAGKPPPEPSSLLASLAGRLPAHLLPSTVTVLDELPLTTNGKLDRRALAGLSPASHLSARPRTPPRTAAERAVAAIWAEVLERRPESVHDDFFELGGQSFAALRVSSLLARRFGRRVPLGTLLERRTVASLALWLGGLDESWSPLVWLRKADGEHPWFFIHPADGTVLCYRRLAAVLDLPFCAIQAPGPAAGLRPLETMEDLTAAYLPALLQAQPRGPYRLGGWSSGAVIALRLAHQLERSGEQVDRLAVLDAPAPVGQRTVDDGEVLAWFLEDLAAHTDRAGLLASAPPPAAGQEGDRLTEALRLAAPDLDPAGLAGVFAVFRGVVRACHDHQAPQVAAPVTVLRAAHGILGEFEGHPSATAPDWGWARLTTGPVTALAIGGTHHTLLSDPHVAAVADALASASGRG